MGRTDTEQMLSTRTATMTVEAIREAERALYAAHEFIEWPAEVDERPYSWLDIYRAVIRRGVA